MAQIRRTNSLNVLRCLCFFWLVAGLTSVAQEPSSTADLKEIVVWQVGSPHSAAVPDTIVPPNLQARAKGLGRSIRIESFPAKGFAQMFFDAFAKHQEPDVIAVDNFGNIQGITTRLGTFTGIKSDPAVSKSLVMVTLSLKTLTSGPGWQFLLSTSKNYEAARQLALLSPECAVHTQLPNSDLEKISQSIADAYLEQSDSLKAYEDSERLVAEGRRTGPAHVHETSVCGSWGNDHLAFVSLVSTYDSTDRLGQAPVLLVLRRASGPWRLLVASTDPISTGRLPDQLSALPGLLQGKWGDGTPPNAVELIAPVDGKVIPFPAPGEPSDDFMWLRNPSDHIVAEVKEFEYQNDARLFLTLHPPMDPTGQITDQLGGVQSVWKWRVWSIADNGAVALSKSRSFRK